nr:hypothetical protein [Mammaliicoccus sp. Marseille-Q6498]
MKNILLITSILTILATIIKIDFMFFGVVPLFITFLILIVGIVASVLSIKRDKLFGITMLIINIILFIQTLIPALYFG